MGVDQDDATVLVVDDEEMVADAFSLLLERWYTVRTAHGGEEALSLVDGDVDVVLLDRRMPDRSGDEVLRDLRGAVEKQLAVRRYDERVSEFFATADKLAALEADHSEATLEANDEYVRLKVRQLELREELDELVEEIDDEDRVPIR